VFASSVDRARKSMRPLRRAKTTRPEKFDRAAVNNEQNAAVAGTAYGFMLSMV